MALVNITAEAQVQFDGLPRKVRTRILAVFERLQQWPDVSGAKPLRGGLAGRYRIRSGDYRIQFQATAGDAEADPPTLDVVLVEKVGHRDGFYDD